MNNNQRLAMLRFSWGSFMLAAMFFACGFITAAERPNILLILSDDMGFSDLGCYGSEIKTPNLDALGTGGIRFTQFYNTARCCPTRASLLTGLYPHQAGVGHMTNDNGLEGYRGELNQQCVTIAEVLREAGYATYMTGKWHVAHENADSDKAAWPLQRGFDKYYGTIRGGGSFYDPTGLCRQNTFITPANDTEYQPETFYYTDALSDNAVKFLRDHEAHKADQPFFLYVAYTAAHWPMHALDKDIAKYHGKYAEGYEAIRAARFERMRKMGLIAADSQLTTEDDAWKKVADKAWEQRCMEVFAAMVDNMDAGIGRIVEQLKQSKKLDNTLILYLQDNGGCAETVGRQSNARETTKFKPLGRDELQPRVTPPMQTRDGRMVRTGPGVMPGPADTFVAYGRDWARVSNTPFREFKHWTHEGGISTPLIAHWPREVKPQFAGTLCHEPGHLIDILATCVDVSSATYPQERNGQKIKPLEGKSLRPALHGLQIAEQRELFWEHEGNRAVRQGKWKLVAKENRAWELYDISVDRTELHDLAEEQPDRVRELAAKWDSYAARANVLPLGGWRGKNAADALSKERVFTLRVGDSLPRSKAPHFVSKSFCIAAKFSADKPADGVLLAHGGSGNGYAIYFTAGKPTFAIRNEEGLRTITAPEALRGKHSILVRVGLDGVLKMSVDGKQVAASETGSLPRMPMEDLAVGRDEGTSVGDYTAPHKFTGEIDSIQIEIE